MVDDVCLDKLTRRTSLWSLWVVIQESRLPGAVEAAVAPQNAPDTAESNL